MDLSAIINIGAVGIIILSLLWALLFRKRAFTRFICAVTSAVLAFAGTIVMKKTLALYTDEVNAALITSLGTENPVSELVSGSPVVAQLLISIICAVSAPIIFLVAFYVLRVVLLVVRTVLAILAKIFLPKLKGPKFRTRLLLGFLQGIIIVICILAPISSYSSLASEVLPALKDSDMVGEEDYAVVEQAVADVNDSMAIQTYRTLGGKFIDKALMGLQVSIGEEEVDTNLDSEITAILEFFSDITTLTSTPLEQYTDKESAVLSNIGTSITESKVLAAIVSDVIKNAANAWDNGQAYMGIEKPSFEPTFDPIIHKTISIIGKDAGNIEYLKQDLNTLATMLTKIVDNLPEDSGSSAPEGEGAQNALLAKGLVKELLLTVNSNPRMRPLIPVITNIGLKLVTESLGIPADSQAAYNKLTEDIAAEIKASASLDADTRQQNMVNAIDSALAKQGITNLGDSEVAIIAMAVISHFDGTNGKNADEVTAQDIAQFLDEMTTVMTTQDGAQTPVSADGEYGFKLLGTGESSAQLAGQLLANIYAVQNNSNLTPDEKQDQISSLINDNSLFTNATVSSDALDSIKVLVIIDIERPAVSSQAAFSSISGLIPTGENTAFKNTADVLLIDVVAFENANVGESEMLEFIGGVSTAFDAFTSLSDADESETMDIFCTGIGSLLDSLATNDAIYGEEKTEQLVGALFQAEAVSGMVGLTQNDIDNILQAKKDVNASYTTIMNGVSSMSQILGSIDGPEGLTEETVGALIDNLSEDNCGSVIAALFTPEKLVELGFDGLSDEQLNTVSSFFNSLLSNISKSDDAEKAAFKNILELAFNSSEEGYEINAEEMIDSFMSSESVIAALIETEFVFDPFDMNLSEEDKAEASDVINTKLVGADDDTTLALYNIAKLLGVEL